MKNIIASLVVTVIFGLTIGCLFLAIDRAGKKQNEDMAELSDKLDNIVSQQDAINARLDELETTMDLRSGGQTDTVNIILKEIHDIKQNINEELDDVYDKIQEVETSKKEKSVTVAVGSAPAAPAYNVPTGGLTPRGGVNYFGEDGEQKETYYNLPMGGVVGYAQAAGIEGEYWVREDGCKMFGDYVIIAANQEVHPYGSVVETSLGPGIVLDTGSFAAGNPYQVDVATDW